MQPTDFLDLAHYRRTVAGQYAMARIGGEGAETWLEWRAARDELLGMHPQSPIPAGERRGYQAEFFSYDPSWRFEAQLQPIPGEPIHLDHSGEGRTPFVKFATVSVGEASLPVFWLNSYGGGIFVPFRDDTNGFDSYGGGRYLLDTVKGADLGTAGGRLVLDFNYAYHPSCVHDSQWSCPLAPTESKLAGRVEAGERLP